MTTVAIDHVIFVVDDLDAASARLIDDHGLVSIPGGRHAGHGTANRIVPLGTSYLELMGVVDPGEAAASPMGRWATSRASKTLIPAALCLRTDDADAEATRLGLAPMAMSRVRPDGVVLSWRLVGADEMFDEERLPFFIQWDDMTLHPGRAATAHRVEVHGIARVGLRGDTTAIAARVGDHDLPIDVDPGAPEVTSMTIATAGGPITLGG